IDSAERKGLPLRRLIFSADRFKDAAIRLGSRDVKTPFSRVSASLCSVTWRDQRRPVRRRRAALCPRPRRLRPALVFDAARLFFIAPPWRKPPFHSQRASRGRVPQCLARRTRRAVGGR